MSETEKSNQTETELCGYCGHPKAEGMSSLTPNICQCPRASDSNDPNIRLGSVPSSAFRRSPSVAIPGQTVVAETNIGLVEIISVREKHGYFRKSIPRMPLPIAIFLCVLNVILPGVGTFLSVFAVLCGCKTEHDSRRRSSLISLLAAFLQLLTAPIIVGWIWSVLWGFTFVTISVSKDLEDTNVNSML